MQALKQISEGTIDMKRIITTLAMAASVALAGCGEKPADKPQPQPSPKATQAPKKDGGGMTPEKIKEFAGNFEQAMQAVPPELRTDFQKYMECENKANLKRPVAEQKPMTPQRVIEMTAALKADRSLATCS